MVGGDGGGGGEREISKDSRRLFVYGSKLRRFLVLLIFSPSVIQDFFEKGAFDEITTMRGKGVFAHRGFC